MGDERVCPRKKTEGRLQSEKNLISVQIVNQQVLEFAERNLSEFYLAGVNSPAFFFAFCKR